MLQINVVITKISAERFSIVIHPQPIGINANLNVSDAERKTEEEFEVNFIFTVNYSPPLANLVLQGKAIVSGDKGEIKKIYETYEQSKVAPQRLTQTISNLVFVESTLIARTLNLPPPIPLPQISTAKPETKVDYRV